MKPRIEMLRVLIRNQHKLMLAMADYLERPDGSGLRKLHNQQAAEGNATGLIGIARATATSGLSCSSGHHQDLAARSPM